MSESTEKKEKKPHDFDRFAVFKISEDKKSFQLKDGTVFQFNEDGGWTDEYGNVYDKDGNAWEEFEDIDDDEEGGEDVGDEEDDEDEYDEDDDEDDEYDEEFEEEYDEEKEITEDTFRNNKNELKQKLIHYVGVVASRSKVGPAKNHIQIQLIHKRDNLTKADISNFLSSKIKEEDIVDFSKSEKTTSGKFYFTDFSLNNFYLMRVRTVENLLRLLDLFGEDFYNFPFIAYPYLLPKALEVEVSTASSKPKEGPAKEGPAKQAPAPEKQETTFATKEEGVKITTE